ncbi:hypothetical protein KIP88_02410 [Bradyrhizobium sp. SRL28]|uniref:hypothetical protein n=1 Tax=Bradyrhizobium sp. SRL28 TaxID=2836178 RepID=UPI001BDE3DD0|nr:hypothetical protein [Bradyrhizobium sp. SRL28]MBT1509342.1 hypothetical protein [Bradyrhizobium sp. SRL28]
MNQTAAVYNRSINAGSMPDRIRRLPISPQGFPVPYFVTWFKNGEPCDDGEGEPDFRVIEARKMKKAMAQHLCWVCGGVLGVHKSFTIGPMCCVTRTISEPPSHRDCSIFSATACPFLSKPMSRRNERGIYDLNGDMLGGLQEPAGHGLKRNPGAVCVWTTKTYHPFKPPGGGMLFSLGRPTEVLWFAEGRKATRREIMASIDSGYPLLEEIAREEGPDAMAALKIQREVAMALVPDR